MPAVLSSELLNLRLDINVSACYKLKAKNTPVNFEFSTQPHKFLRLTPIYEAA